MWGKIIIPIYRLWLNGLYGLYGSQCPLFSKRPINLISLSCRSVYIYKYNCVFESLILDVTCNYVSADGERDGLWWSALPGHWLSYTGCWQSLLVMYWLLCLGCCFYFNHLPRMFLSTDLAFRITDWTCCHGPHLHAILRIISRGVSGLATDSPCGIWGRGWTTCLLHDSPLFGSHFEMRVGM